MEKLALMTPEQKIIFERAKKSGSVLNFNVTRNWFDKFLSRQKRYEFRDVKIHWIRILMDIGEIDYRDYASLGLSKEEVDTNITSKVKNGTLSRFKNFSHVVIRNGFARNGKPAPYLIAIDPNIELWHGKENDLMLEDVFAINIKTIIESYDPLAA